MEKINEIRNVLDFYVTSDKLKNRLFPDKVYSYADNRYGALILATAVNSEKKETLNIGSTYREILFTEFHFLEGKNKDDKLIFDKLKLGKLYYDEMQRTKHNTPSRQLVHKYLDLDSILTLLIDINISEDELIEKATKIIADRCSLNQVQSEEIFKFYRQNHKLKKKVRTGWDPNHWNIKSNRIERISEHVIGTLNLAISMYSEFEYDIDIEKVVKMLVIHEIGETIIPDFTPFDNITPERKLEEEHKAMEKVLGNLSEKDELLALLFEFDERKTKEAKFAHYIDKLDADLKSKLYQDQGLHHPLSEQKNNVVFTSPKIKKILKSGVKNAFDVWYEYDKSIYEGDKDFPEFIDILKVAKYNNLLDIRNVIKDEIIINKNEANILSKVIIKIAEDLYKDENIQAVYLTNYGDKINTKGNIHINILTNSINYPTKEYMEKIEKQITMNNSTNIHISLSHEYINDYSTCCMTHREVFNMDELYESTILFDKTNELSKLQKEWKRYKHSFPYELINYIPPIDQEIAHKLSKSIK